MVCIIQHTKCLNEEEMKKGRNYRKLEDIIPDLQCFFKYKQIIFGFMKKKIFL